MGLPIQAAHDTHPPEEPEPQTRLSPADKAIRTRYRSGVKRAFTEGHKTAR